MPPPLPLDHKRDENIIDIFKTVCDGAEVFIKSVKVHLDALGTSTRTPSTFI